MNYKIVVTDTFNENFSHLEEPIKKKQKRQ